MKVALFILTIILSSCGSFLLTGNEVLTEMYVKDSTGCMLKKAVVSTNKLNRFGVYDLSFYLEYDSFKIHIPHLEMDLNHNNYVGVSTNGKKYTVTYLSTRRGDIRIEGDNVLVEVSKVDICKQ